MDELDLIAAGSKAACGEIQTYIEETAGLRHLLSAIRKGACTPRMDSGAGAGKRLAKIENQQDFFCWQADIILHLICFFYMHFLPSVAGLSISAPSSPNREP